MPRRKNGEAAERQSGDGKRPERKGHPHPKAPGSPCPIGAGGWTPGVSRARVLMFFCAALCGFVVSANLRNTFWPLYLGKWQVSANRHQKVARYLRGKMNTNKKQTSRALGHRLSQFLFVLSLSYYFICLIFYRMYVMHVVYVTHVLYVMHVVCVMHAMHVMHAMQATQATRAMLGNACATRARLANMIIIRSIIN